MNAELISVVVAAYNAERLIGRCLESLFAMEYPAERLEIIVVDNGSTDRTAEIIDGFPVVRLDEALRGSTGARNTGIASARGSLIAFTDSDCIVEPDWAAEIEHAFQAPDVAAVMGYTGGINANFWAHLEQDNYEDFWYRNDAKGMTLRRIGIDTRNSAIRCDVLAALGNFRSELLFCADLEFSVRMRAAGLQVVLNKRMRAHHHNRTDLNQILRIKRDHGRAFVQIVTAQPDGLDSPHLPSDFRRYLGIDNRSIRGPLLTCAHFLLTCLSTLLVILLRGCAWFMDRPNRIALRLFKTLCSIPWELAILDARRRRIL